MWAKATPVAPASARLASPRKGTKAGITWEDVPAPAVPQAGNVNPAEVAAIVRHLRKLLVEDEYGGSIGVITPFRAQVLALDNAIATAIDEPKRMACDLKVGTVDGFQGQERDLILFSPCVGPRSSQSGMTFFQRDTRRLNVAISRARAVAIVFGDLDFARSGKSKALGKLAAMATEPRTKRGEGVFDSDWERKVYHALKARGLDPQPQHEIAGRRLDFALFGANGVKLDLEVDGRKWHEIDVKQNTIDDLEAELVKRREAMAVVADLQAEVDGLRRQKEELLAEWESRRERREEVAAVRKETENAVIERQRLEAEIAPLRAEYLAVKEQLEKAEELVGRIGTLKLKVGRAGQSVSAL